MLIGMHSQQAISAQDIKSRLTPMMRGQLGESIAARYLTEHGYTIAHRNWRPTSGMRGELDIIAHVKETVVFVEVKTRTSHQYGLPEEAVTPHKMRAIRKLAAEWLHVAKPHVENLRIDVIAVTLTLTGAGIESARIEHFEGVE